MLYQRLMFKGNNKKSISLNFKKFYDIDEYLEI